MMFKYNIGELVRFKYSEGAFKYMVVHRTYFDSGQGAIVLYELRTIGIYGSVSEIVFKAHEHELQPYVEHIERKEDKDLQQLRQKVEEEVNKEQEGGVKE